MHSSMLCFVVFSQSEMFTRWKNEENRLEIYRRVRDKAPKNRMVADNSDRNSLHHLLPDDDAVLNKFNCFSNRKHSVKIDKQKAISYPCRYHLRRQFASSRLFTIWTFHSWILSHERHARMTVNDKIWRRVQVMRLWTGAPHRIVVRRRSDAIRWSYFWLRCIRSMASGRNNGKCGNSKWMNPKMTERSSWKQIQRDFHCKSMSTSDRRALHCWSKVCSNTKRFGNASETCWLQSPDVGPDMQICHCKCGEPSETSAARKWWLRTPKCNSRFGEWL